MTLALSDVHCAYGPVRVLKGVTLRVEAGEVLALLGRNGAGKTTMLKAIMGLVPCRQGSIQLDGEELTRLPAHAIPRLGIGYVPQGRRLFPELSVAENLRMGLLVRNNAPEALERVLSFFPALRERLGQSAGTLSGGEQQMLALGRALCVVPRLLLLDEPAEGLQPAAAQKLLDTIASLKAHGVAVLLVEQKADAALRVADRVAFLENGALVHEARAAQVAREPALLERYIGVRRA
jgi:branched-chain amino acid transport system ATP-binding protein